MTNAKPKQPLAFVVHSKAKADIHTQGVIVLQRKGDLIETAA